VSIQPKHCISPRKLSNRSGQRLLKPLKVFQYRSSIAYWTG
jgi:hypothetical protein